MAIPNNEFKYDVFLSFRGKDNLHGFPENLWKALHNKGINTFIDDVEFRKGHEITPSLMKAIQDSKRAIIVLSMDYASSSSCLQTLSMILQSIKDKGRLVLPVFYQLDGVLGRSESLFSLDPSAVRWLMEFYEKAMAKHEMSSNRNVEKWKTALEVVAGLPGFAFKNWFHKSLLIWKIVHELVKYPKENDEEQRKGQEITAFPNGPFKYDVFLSFRGEDTRSGFTRNLYEALINAGIKTFMDDELPRGVELTPALIKTIQDSSMAIIVLSENFATSSFCLQELSTILVSIKDKGRFVWPVFYDVEPSDVRNLKGSYEKAMAKHETRSERENWKKDLKAVANLTGYTIKKREGYDYERYLIDKIVEDASRKFKPRTLHVPDYLVGLEYKKENLTCHLRSLSDVAVHMVGIYGTGGIGKTTLAIEVFNSIAHEFQHCLYLEKVRENSAKNNGLINLQENLLSQIGSMKINQITSVRIGIEILKKELLEKKILLLLDDVDSKEQLETLAGDSNWFGLGSRVIITTRDIRLLTMHGVETKYDMKELNDEDAFELVKWHAFKGKDLMADKNSAGYMGVLKRTVKYASGLPVALEVIGSQFFGMPIEQCKPALDRYERNRNGKIQPILQVSYDALQDDEKSVFLDIACFFNGYNLTTVKQILNAHYDDIMEDHINVLVDKSLIKIVHGKVTLHDLLKDMGRAIVTKESKDPGKRSRLWASEDLIKVLKGNTGTNKIEIICLDSWIDVDWDGTAFKKMDSLKTLIIRDGQFTQSPKHLPNSLRILELRLRPSWDLPSDFDPKFLVMCSMPSISPSLVLKGFFQKKFKDMKVLKFDCNKLLTGIPDISGLVHLEELSFRDCKSLSTFDVPDGVSFAKLKILRAKGCIKLSSIPPLKLDSLEELDLSECYNLESFLSSEDGLSDKLKLLNIKHCVMLRSVPPLRLTSLEEFNLSYCPSLETFPKILGEVRNIPKLDLFDTYLKDVPLQFQNPPKYLLTSLRCDCRNAKLPMKVYAMSMLAQLTLEAETKLSRMQSSHVECFCLKNSRISDEFLFKSLMLFVNMKELHLTQMDFTILPKSIENCKSLLKLVLDDCEKLQEIEGIPLSLETLSMRNCHFTILPKLFENCKSLWKLVLDGCEKLQEIEGIPPNLKTLSAKNCISLTSSCKSTLLKKELHEAGKTVSVYILPRDLVPEWFQPKNQCRDGISISFLFRNKFPAVVLGVVSPTPMGRVTVSINNNTSFSLHDESTISVSKCRWGWYHLQLFHMQLENFNDNMDNLNELNHAKVHFEHKFGFHGVGIHVLNDDILSFEEHY